MVPDGRVKLEPPATGHPPRAAPAKPVKHPQIPAEWRMELPDSGAANDAEFGGCRSIEAGYARGPVLGQGTYGEVYLATELHTSQQVAAKKIKMDNEKEGFPITAIREIKILSALATAPGQLEDGLAGHSTLLRNNVIGLREIVRSSSHRHNNFKGSIYMMFDYMDHDMTGLLERSQKEGRRFTAAQVKCYLKQLFAGLWLLDSKNVLHRDLKNANLLVNNRGELKIADFGLARYYTKAGEGEGSERGADQRMTNRVITLWYRPPELFLGSEHYGTEIDTWSAGCIMFELLTGKPLFPGKDETDQLDKILTVMGQPTEQTMPGFRTYRNHGVVPERRYPTHSRLRQHCQDRGVSDPNALNLLEKLLALNPAARIKAAHAVTHEYFFRDPLPCKLQDMPKFPSSHEMTMKRARQEQRHGAGQQRPQQGQGRSQQGYAQQQQGQGQGGGPAAQRQRTQGQYSGPQLAQQQPHRGGSVGGLAPYRGGGGGAAPVAGGMRAPAAAGVPGAPPALMPGTVWTQEQLQHMMAQQQVNILSPGMVQPPQGPGYGFAASGAVRPAAYAPASGGGRGPTGMLPHNKGGGAQPSWDRQRR